MGCGMPLVGAAAWLVASLSVDFLVRDVLMSAEGAAVATDSLMTVRGRLDAGMRLPVPLVVALGSI